MYLIDANVFIEALVKGPHFEEVEKLRRSVKR
jgi:predicted nucleic acid-binding protein